VPFAALEETFSFRLPCGIKTPPVESLSSKLLCK